MLRRRSFRPLTTRGRRVVAAILFTIALSSILSYTLSTRASSQAKNQASVVEVAGRQRTLAERYVNDVLLVRAGEQAAPETTAKVLERSAQVLISGGKAPATDGDDDEVTLAPTTEPVVRAQLVQDRSLVRDLIATGNAILQRSSLSAVPQTAHERISVHDPVTRLRVLASLSSNVSLNAARTIAQQTDDSIDSSIRTQGILGIAGLLTSLVLAFALIAVTRRQTAHFRSLVTSSTDLVLVFGGGECRYVSKSVTDALGASDSSGHSWNKGGQQR